MGSNKREKGIVVNVAPAGPMSGADRQYRPGSSGTQHAHKRTRTSLAQRVPTKPELCKANEGMTRTCTRNPHRCTASSQTALSV